MAIQRHPCGFILSSDSAQDVCEGPAADSPLRTHPGRLFVRIGQRKADRPQGGENSRRDFDVVVHHLAGLSFMREDAMSWGRLARNSLDLGACCARFGLLRGGGVALGRRCTDASVQYERPCEAGERHRGYGGASDVPGDPASLVEVLARTAARFRICSGFPAALMSSLSGTWTVMVITTTTRRLAEQELLSTIFRLIAGGASMSLSAGLSAIGASEMRTERTHRKSPDECLVRNIEHICQHDDRRTDRRFWLPRVGRPALLLCVPEELARTGGGEWRLVRVR
jgi:hypothetical protein